MGNLAVFTSNSQAANKGGSIVLGGTYTGTTAYQFAGIAGLKENSTAGNAAGYLAFYTTDSGNASPERMRIDSSGLVRIQKNTASTTEPLLKLSNANGSTTDGVKMIFEVANTSGNGGEIAVVRDGGSFNPYMTFNVSSGVSSAPSERMRIDSSGNVGINEDSPDTILHIQQPSNDRAGGIYSQVNGGSYGISMFVNSGGYGIIGGNGTYPNDVISMDFNNAYVGIGISPQFKLHVIGASATEATVARFAKGNFADTGGHTTIIGLGTENTATWTKAALAFERTSSYDTGKIHFLQDNTFDTSTATLSDSVMTIDRTGNVSIGATTINGSFGTSNTILAVKGSSSGGEGILQLTGLANNATDIAGRIEFHSQAEADPMCSIRAIRGSADDIGSLSFLVNNGGSPDTKMTIASDGDIIASQDTDITARFGRAHIGYVGHADHAGFSHLDRDNAFDYALLQDSGGDTYVNAASGKQVHLRINNQNALEISQYEYMKASGRNHSPTYGSGYTFHSIEADEANEPTLMVFNDTTNESYGINVIANVDRNNTTSRFFMGQGGSTERIKIYSNGNIQNSNNSYGQLSDRKLKENIEDATPKLDDLMQVQIKNF